MNPFIKYYLVRYVYLTTGEFRELETSEAYADLLELNPKTQVLSSEYLYTKNLLKEWKA